MVETWRNPVFGDTFPEHDQRRLDLVSRQIGTLAVALAEELGSCIENSMPEYDEVSRTQIIRQIVPKTAAFAPALAAGEINDSPKLLAFAVAVSRMYWADQSMDRGDLAMPEAVLYVVGQDKSAPVRYEPSQAAHSRAIGLHHIEQNVAQLARPEDTQLVLRCFYDQVLRHEVFMHWLSGTYKQLDDEQDRRQFLSTYATQIAEISTISAGFPSISSALYAIYRWENPTLPPLSEIYSSQPMVDLLQICNVVSRLWDEFGDREMDRGDHPMGEFVINPFNQYHAAMIQRFGELAFMREEQISTLQTAFAEFHEDTTKHGDTILQLLLEHVRDYVAKLPPAVGESFYVQCCRRVLEIAHVNTRGDPALVDQRD